MNFESPQVAPASATRDGGCRTRLRIRGLESSVTKGDLRELLRVNGVLVFELNMEDASGFAFFVVDEAEADYAIRTLSGQIFHDKRLFVERAHGRSRSSLARYEHQRGKRNET